MQRLVALMTLVVSAGSIFAADPVTDVRPTIHRGIAFLVKDSLAWKEKHKCDSCHHAALVVWSMQEAKRAGYEVDESFLTETTTWIAQSGEGKTSVPRPESAPKALNEKALLYAIAVNSIPAPDDAAQAGLKLFLRTIKADQIENGSWSSWPETRPPFFGNSEERATLLATLALLPAASRGDEDAAKARDKAVHWLDDLKTHDDDESQVLALRLLLWQRLGRSESDKKALIDQIRERENSDGGWSQTKEMKSDAWATGQALYVLAEAGVPPADPAIQRGHSFLVTTQREDGSWVMTSRPTKPGGAGSNSLIPITGGGSAWGVLGLVRSAKSPVETR